MFNIANDTDVVLSVIDLNEEDHDEHKIETIRVGAHQYKKPVFQVAHPHQTYITLDKVYLI